MLEKVILLGNGFSRSFDDETFAYPNLLDAAKFDHRVTSVFEKIGTTDFELVMRRLRQARAIAAIYGLSKASKDEILGDVNKVRSGLIRAIRSHHPTGADQVDDDEYANCAAFLRKFSAVFTLNYDLLLYWVILEHLSLQFTDGFGGSPLEWGRNPQNTHYLHGALHLFVDDDDVVHKLRYREGPTIMAQLRDALAAGRTPLFVSEGTSKQKLRQIRLFPYLSHCYRKLATNTRPLTIYGFRFGAQDKHIVSAIAKSSTPSLEVVLYSGSSPSNQQTIKDRARRLAESIKLPGGGSASITFMPSHKLKVWR
jgi:hypothetical protein